MDIKKILPEFGVAAQMSAADVAQAAAEGIKSIICNRPDGEAPNQPVEQEIRDAAAAHGITFRSIPFTAGKQTSADIARFGEALSELPSPVLAYCRTGTRSANIWAQSRVSSHGVNETVELAAKAGIDLSGARGALEKIASA